MPIAPQLSFLFFFFNDTATTEIYTLSLHDALPILELRKKMLLSQEKLTPIPVETPKLSSHEVVQKILAGRGVRSEEHTSELQSLAYLVCRLLLEKKKNKLIKL